MSEAQTLPTVDVIILSWNRTETTLETIENTLAQQGVDIQIYVFDQGSDEEQLTALREIAVEGKIKLIENGENIGPGGGRNELMKIGTGEYIVGIDNDAEFEHENTIRLVIDRFESDETLGLMGFRILNFYTGEDDMHSMATYPDELLAQLDNEFNTSRYVACGHAIRRSVYAQTKGYDDELFFTCEERDLAYQIINLGYNVIYYPQARVRHKVSPEARFWWKGNRYYYLSRNAIYLDYKYYQQAQRTTILFFGYIVRSVRNGVLGQGLRGVFDSLKMIRNLNDDTIVKLTDEARQYIWENDGQFRGNVLKRARRDLLRALVPATENDKEKAAS